ncbi:MAG TPA: hypothetical protein VFR78_22230 [Pyrinomonadaceae bacterium]|nr:hypothetical protein [Pyrinomonadaceae bacterium]
MMKEYDLQPPADISAPPEQPHFDDTRAVLSAQPVVPLDEIDATVKTRRRLFVLGAFVLAMVLGAASAIVAAYVKWRNAPQVTASETVEEAPVEEEPVASAEAMPGGPSEPSESAVAEEDIQAPEVFVAPVEQPRRRSARVRNADVAPARRESSGDEDEDLDHIRDAVLYDEWQERRARRVLRRERRRAQRDNSRDLTNLDEIFEGRRRRRP